MDDRNAKAQSREDASFFISLCLCVRNPLKKARRADIATALRALIHSRGAPHFTVSLSLYKEIRVSRVCLRGFFAGGLFAGAGFLAGSFGFFVGFFMAGFFTLVTTCYVAIGRIVVFLFFCM